MRTKPTEKGAQIRGPITFSGRSKPNFPTKRTEKSPDGVRIWGWPSRGGVTVLDSATPVDLDFLGWDSVNPPLKRDRDQDAEDEVCRRLLLLGSGWYDSQERYDILAGVIDGFDPAIFQIESGEVPPATRTERRWVKVGWPSMGSGLWVAEFDNPIYGPPWSDPNIPTEGGQALLARNMDERCEILKRLGAKFFARLEDYDGAGSLRGWEEKFTGEVGPLVITRYVEW